MLVNLNDVLKKAQNDHYAIGFFSTTDSDMLEAVISAAEELNSPVVIGTAEILLPYGELKLISPALIEAAKRAKVPVVVHYDHGLTFDKCMEALKYGFSSVMYDASTKDYETNINETREIVKIAHSFGASVEAEIGNKENAVDENGKPDMCTTAEQAKAYIDTTGVDALAIAIGTAHGVYKSKPKLNVERLKEIRVAVETPLVLHGGSGLPEKDFKATIDAGITKVNIFTDILLAGDKAVKEGIEKRLGYLETRKLKVKYMKSLVKEKIRLLGSENKA